MSNSAEDAYAALVERSKEVTLIGSLITLAHWDQSVGLLPPAAADCRAQQLAYLAGWEHARRTAPEVGEWLAALEASDLVKDPNSDAAVNVREIARDYRRAVKLPSELVKEIARATSVGERAWIEARRKSDFALFAPALERHIELARQVAEAVGYEQEPYDALIEEYEPGMTAARLADILNGLGAELVPLVERIANSGRKPTWDLHQGIYPVDRQEKLGRQVVEAIGFDLKAGRLDTSAHPVTEAVSMTDVRLTSRYDEHDLRESVLAALHEAGHGLYYQGLDPQHFGTPRGGCRSFALHESQARLWENAVGRSRSFWVYFFPQAQKLFPEALGNVGLDDFLEAINEVSKDFIRVGADEVTYNLHIMLRFQMERELFSGRLNTRDVPAAWNEKFQAIFGMTPPDDSHGCLQDIHWSHGSFGYFPSYMLGNLYAAQLMAQARSDMPTLDQDFEQGNFLSLREWLRVHVHQVGRKYQAADLVERVTGQALSHRALIDQLTERYAGP